SGSAWSPAPYKNGSCFSEDSSLLAVEGNYSIGLKLLDAATGAARYRPDESIANLSWRMYSRKVVMRKSDAAKDGTLAEPLRKCLPDGILPGKNVHVEILDLETATVEEFTAPQPAVPINYDSQISEDGKSLITYTGGLIGEPFDVQCWDLPFARRWEWI